MPVDLSRHPCFNDDVRHQFGRIHLPVAADCNVQCNFCDRRFNCVNESRPGVTTAVLSPHQALRYLDEALQQIYPDWSEEDRRALRDESRREFEPEAMVQYREKPQTARFSTIDEHGFRIGFEQGPWPPEKRFFNIFFLGGSTAFGYGVPDEETISSHLQRLLGAVDLARAPRVYNFGRGAFYSSMERISPSTISRATSRSPEVRIPGTTKHESQ